jgi:regulatory protein
MENKIDQDNINLAINAARRFISYRPRSESELKRRLLQKFDSIIVDETISQMHRENLLDDKRFAQMWVNSRNSSRPKSAFMIIKELKEKGVSKIDAETAVLKVNDQENALAIATKKSRSLKDLPKTEYDKKLTAHLTRRGFGFNTIQTSIALAWQEMHQ